MENKWEMEIWRDLMGEFVRGRTATDAPMRLGRVFTYHPTGPALTKKEDTVRFLEQK